MNKKKGHRDNGNKTMTSPINNLPPQPPPTRGVTRDATKYNEQSSEWRKPPATPAASCPTNPSAISKGRRRRRRRRIMFPPCRLLCRHIFTSLEKTSLTYFGSALVTTISSTPQPPTVCPCFYNDMHAPAPGTPIDYYLAITYYLHRRCCCYQVFFFPVYLAVMFLCLGLPMRSLFIVIR